MYKNLFLVLLLTLFCAYCAKMKPYTGKELDATDADEIALCKSFNMNLYDSQTQPLVSDSYDCSQTDWIFVLVDNKELKAKAPRKRCVHELKSSVEVLPKLRLTKDGSCAEVYATFKKLYAHDAASGIRGN